MLGFKVLEKINFEKIYSKNLYKIEHIPFKELIFVSKSAREFKKKYNNICNINIGNYLNAYLEKEIFFEN